ncbi:TolC family protein [Candidatus Kirkpatrickella diaphorinae]|uniref:TolC family protein n=1 Tax=Candidatus Kirkpatrickella diaphorinae TaxID=2984322 RepID=A0ABY6GKI5_9PROT|nr:TolC family protein [Candidatus Kirkpatrickella diaphorinae]UYH51975.1 TolC family protein [Candidatus Kirkpatrickella diaphorinae]
MTFRQALNAAWNNDPIRQELAVNASSARARAAAARAWFAGGPSFTASYYDDRAAGTHIGYITYEGTVSVPLWLPGQGTATETVAKADAAKAVAQVDVERVAIAVRVLQQAEEVSLAQRRLTIARAMAKSLSRMADVTHKAYEAGEATSADMQAVSAQLADARSEIAMAEAERTASSAAMMTLLGRAGTPDLSSADDKWLARWRPDHISDMEMRDPRVVASHKEVMAAQAQMHLAHHNYMPNPEVGLVALDQGQYASPWATQVGMTIRVALPSDVQNVPQIAAAQNRLAAATRAEVASRRAVHDELRRVISWVDGARQALNQSRQSAAQTLSRAKTMEHSWSLGETPLIEALRAQNDAWRALMSLNRAEIAFHAAVIRLCIATGTLP